MALTPENASDSLIEKLFDDELKRAETLASVLDKVEEIMHKPPEPTTVPELLFHTKKRHQYAFARVPVGHDLGWCCYDPNKYDGDHADGNCTMGYGKTQDEAYVDLLHQMDDEEPKRKPGFVVHSSPFEPPTYMDNPGYRDEE